MTTGNRKTSNNRNRNKSNSNSRKRQTKKERMAEIEKTEAFRTEVILWRCGRSRSQPYSVWTLRTYGICITCFIAGRKLFCCF